MGYALLGSLWQGVLVALLLAGALAVIPRTKSSLRYWCGCIALFALPVLFCATAVFVSERANVMEPIAPQTTTVAMGGTVTEKIDLPTSGGGTGHIAEPVVSAAADIEPGEVPAPATPWRRRLSDTVKPWTGHIVLCWFVGVFAMSVWNLGGWIAVRRLRCIGISAVSECFVTMLGELAGRLGVKHPVRLLQSAVVQSPMTIGWLKPVILVPASILCELSPKQIETILAHELVHVRRFDYLVNLLQTVVETLLFHHPAVWWISHKIRSERECCCDDAVVKLTADELNYAKALTAIADLRRNVPQLAVAASGGSLLSRIQRILGLSNKKTLSGSTWLASLLALIICIAAAVTMVNAAASPPRDAAAQKLIIGTWKSNTFSGHWADRYTSLSMTFEQNGSGEATSILADDARQKENTFTWKFDGRKLLLGTDKLDDDPEAYRWNIRRNKLRLRDDKGLMEFERVEKQNANDVKVKSLVGVWKYDDVSDSDVTKIDYWVLEFNRNQTGRSSQIGFDGEELESVSFVYKIDGDRISAKNPDSEDESEIAQWRMEADVLHQIGKDRTYQFTRLNADESIKPDDIESPIGTWDMIEGTGPYARGFKSVTVVFDADGRWTLESVDSKGQKDSKEGRYTFKGGRVWFRENDDLVIELDADRMTISDNDTTFTFKRRDDAEAVSEDTAAATPAESLIGRWKCTDVPDEEAERGVDSMILEFNSDHSGRSSEIGFEGKELNTETFDYKVEGNIISGKGPDPDDNWEPIQWRIEGGILFLTDDEDKTYEYKRLNAAEEPEGAAPADEQSILGTWETIEITGKGNVHRKHVWTFSPDGSLAVRAVSSSGEHDLSATYILQDGLIKTTLDEHGSDTVIRLHGNRIILTNGDTKAVFRKRTATGDEAASSAKVDITPYVGTWVVSEDNQRLMYLLVVKPDGRAVGTKAMEPRQLPNLRIVDGQVVLNDGSDDYAIRMQGEMLVGSKLEDGKPWPCTVRRFQPDPKIVGSWSATDIPENVYRTTAIFLDLKDDATFTLQSEGGGSSGVPDRGLYSTDGDMIRFFGGSSNNLATPGSARYHNGTIRIGLQHSTAVLKRDVANPFEGSEHPMFRVDLISSTNGLGNKLDLDTGESVSAEKWEQMAEKDRAMFELTISLGKVKLTSSNRKAKMLPVRDAGMSFAKAGASAVKYLSSLEKSRLRGSDYKGGIFLAVLTDRGNLAVVQMMTPTGEDQTPVGWSLAQIHKDAGEAPTVELTQTDPVAEETVEIKPIRVTIPDADTKNVPTILDLAGGEMLPFPDDIEGVDLLGHFTKLGKGDLLFDRLFAVLRGGKAQIWNDGQWTPFTPEDRQADATAYKLPESLPCRLLVTTGDGKQFEVNALARTAYGGLEIEYKPVGDKVTMPGKEGAHSATHTMEYTVKPGDTLAKIVETVYGTSGSYKEIMKMNNLANADSLTVGMVLKMPEDVASSFHIARAFIEALKLKDHAAAMMLCKFGSTEAGASAKLVQTFDFNEAKVEQAFESPAQAMAVVGPVKILSGSTEVLHGQTARFGISMEPAAGSWQIRDLDFLPQGKAKKFVGDFQAAYPDARSTWPKD